MIKIEPTNVNDIKADFVKRIEDSVIKNKLSKTERNRLRVNSFANGNELQKKIHNLYICEPSLLKKENDEFETYLINNNYTHRQKKNIQFKYFDYKTTIDYIKEGVNHAYWLMLKLDIKVCPYCNRSYTFTILDAENRIRPEFDHFHCQDNSPYLSLSFYNLIPSCPTCNHKKRTDEININPYIEGFGDSCVFRIDKIEKCLLDSNKYNEWNVSWNQHDEKFNSNIKVFLLTEFYNEHKDFISEIAFKTQAYNSGYYQTLIETFTNQGLSEKEMQLLIFGVYTDYQDLGLRPLSKLSRDIIKQIDAINV